MDGRTKKRCDMANEEGKALEDLLKKLRSGGDLAEVREQTRAFLDNVDSHKLALMEQEIAQERVSREEIRRLCDAYIEQEILPEAVGTEEIRQLCDTHLEVVSSALGQMKIDLPLGHPMRTFMEEHNFIKLYVAALEDILKRTEAEGTASTLPRERETIQYIARLLIEVNNHHQREEEGLFPALIKHGITAPLFMMILEHQEPKAKKQRLLELSQDSSRIISPEWQSELIEASKYLVKAMSLHIYKEDNTLYPIALRMLSKEEWGEMKQICDRIGYASFTPSH